MGGTESEAPSALAVSSVFELAARLMAAQPGAITRARELHSRLRAGHLCDVCSLEHQVWWPCTPYRIAQRADEIARYGAFLVIRRGIVMDESSTRRHAAVWITWMKSSESAYIHAVTDSGYSAGKNYERYRTVCDREITVPREHRCSPRVLVQEYEQCRSCSHWCDQRKQSMRDRLPDRA
jgi:hypothetical protein